MKEGRAPDSKWLSSSQSFPLRGGTDGGAVTCVVICFFLMLLCLFFCLFLYFTLNIYTFCKTMKRDDPHWPETTAVGRPDFLVNFVLFSTYWKSLLCMMRVLS